jgi:transcriptional regulator with XRE-family HTH domain
VSTSSTSDPTEGARCLRELPGSLAELAEQVGCSRQTIANWRTGSKVPDAQSRALIHAVWGIPPEAWGVAPHTQLARVPGGSRGNGGASDPPSGPPPSTLAGCLELLALLRADRQREGLLPADRLRAADTEARILALRHRLEREQELLEARIVLEHPRWHMIERAVAKALAPYPEAREAVKAALVALEGTPPTPPP